MTAGLAAPGAMRATARHLVAALVAAAVVLSAPFMGQARAALRAAFPGRFATLVAAAVAAAIAAALLAALARVRDRRLARYAAIGGAVAAGVLYSAVTATGIPDVDAVERVHFVQYGLISWLFYRAWRGAADLSIVVLPLMAGIVVGTFDEWFQWFVPNRVGEARDVLLNLAAIACGLAFGLGVDPPPPFSWTLRSGSGAAIGRWSAAALLTFALFVGVVHLGHEITDPAAGRFRSRYTSAALAAHAGDRAERWRHDPPLTLVRLSREDQYMDEGLWHVRQRNQSWAAGDYAGAWSENRILETYFAPVLDTPSYAAPAGSRWPASQRAEAEVRGGGAAAGYVSRAEPYPLLLWPRGPFLLTAALGAGLLGLAGSAHERRKPAVGAPVAV